MQYGISGNKIAHIVRENSSNGLCGYWDTVCGKWIHPTDIFEEIPGGARLCSHCKKHKEA